MTTRTPAKVREWEEKRRKAEEAEGGSDTDADIVPEMGMRYHELEAAAYFGIPIDEFLGKPLDRQAEMIAHVSLKAKHDNYVRARLEEREKNKSKESGGGYNPMEIQRRKWMLG